MSTTNQILNLFANSNVVSNIPHIQEDLLAECDQLARLALSHTCALYRDIYDSYRLNNLALRDVAFDVRDPNATFITHDVVKKAGPGVWGYQPSRDSKYVVKRARKPATEKELAVVIEKSQTFHCLTFEMWAPPPSTSESDWYSEDGYKGIVTPGGAVLSKGWGIYDSMFGNGYREVWKIPESSGKKGFTVADYRDLYVGRYKKEKKGGDPYKVYSKYWKSGGKSVIIWCTSDNMHDIDVQVLLCFLMTGSTSSNRCRRSRNDIPLCQILRRNSRRSGKSEDAALVPRKLTGQSHRGQLLLSTVTFLHPPSRAYIDPWSGEQFGEGGMEQSLRANKPPVHPPILGAEEEVSSCRSWETLQQRLLSGGQLGNYCAHTMTLRYPEVGNILTLPTLLALYLCRNRPRTNGTPLSSYFHLLSRLYPCGECAAEFQMLLKKYPPQTSSRLSASLWLCSVHNRVNERLKKDQFDCAHLDDTYDCGCGDDPIGASSLTIDPMDLGRDGDEGGMMRGGR
ncbi:Sulfhydryl oxidase [Mycena venus]|uniref:Sulfhydryl oxidase n=1 Tax=Mycena venus TaxID=2733690 RepID=A0A8H6YNP3_9AGAR|nr:Sulfhydryl oxidase [Mycena venus]